MHLFRWKKQGGGGPLMHVYVWDHSLSYRTDWLMLTKYGRDEEIMALHMHLGFLARSAQKWNQSSTKIGQGGALFFKGLLLHIGMQQQQTECIPVY